MLTAAVDALQVAAVRAALDKYGDRLDEGLLSNCFAWMKKCQDDRMDTMVALLQKILQLYAAKALQGQETEVSTSLGLLSATYSAHLLVVRCASCRMCPADCNHL